MKNIAGKVVGRKSFAVIFDNDIYLSLLIAGCDKSILSVCMFKHIGNNFLKNTVNLLSLIGRESYLLYIFLDVALNLRTFQRLQFIGIESQDLI